MSCILAEIESDICRVPLTSWWIAGSESGSKALFSSVAEARDMTKETIVATTMLADGPIK